MRGFYSINNSPPSALAQPTARFGRLAALQAEFLGRVFIDMRDGLVYRIGHEEELKVRLRDRPLLGHPLQKIYQRLPVLRAHQDDGKVRDLTRLNQRDGLEHLVHRPHPARQADEAIRVLEQKHLSDEKKWISTQASR